ncbi:MAG: hypothetical protein AB7C97_09250 [Oscillospiraceae bacterium]
MGELEDKLNSILSSPEEMQKIMGLARSISGSMGEASKPGANPENIASAIGDIDPKMFKVMTKILGEYSASPKSDKAVLLSAMKPYLKDERRKSVDRAIEIAKFAKVARLALSEFSGGDFHL